MWDRYWVAVSAQCGIEKKAYLGVQFSSGRYVPVAKRWFIVERSVMRPGENEVTFVPTYRETVHKCHHDDDVPSFFQLFMSCICLLYTSDAADE